MLPWIIAEAEWLKKHMRDGWWPYGVGPNKAALDTLLRFHHEQGLSKRWLEAHERFAPETLEAFKI